MEGRKDDQKSNENEGTTKKAMRKKESNENTFFLLKFLNIRYFI